MDNQTTNQLINGLLIDNIFFNIAPFIEDLLSFFTTLLSSMELDHFLFSLTFAIFLAKPTYPPKEDKDPPHPTAAFLTLVLPLLQKFGVSFQSFEKESG